MKRLSIYFLIAILLPALVLGFLGYSTFTKRQEAVRSLLASSLWVSAEGAVRSIENAILEEERTALLPDNFVRLIEAQDRGEALERYSFPGDRVQRRYFLLDRSFKIFVPKTESSVPALLPWPPSSAGGPFQSALARAERLEFMAKDRAQAAEAYRKCASQATSQRERAIALEGLGRSLLLSREYEAAFDVYHELDVKLGDERNRAGHPFAIIARLQLSEIERRRGRAGDSARRLFELYQRMRNGAWSIDRTCYEFFSSEIGSRLGGLNDQGPVAEARRAFETVCGQPSPYLDGLAFTDLLRREAVAEIGDKMAALPAAGSGRKGRLMIGSGDEATLVSYCDVPELQSRGAFFGGFYWDPDSLRKGALPLILDTISKESGLSLWLIGEGGRDVLSGEPGPPVPGAISLPFDMVPFPWKLVASQPGRAGLERDVLRGSILYGALLAAIVMLMFLGAVLILRDIAREKETTRQRIEFVNNVSHEFKTPLTLIRLYNETLEHQKGLGPEEKKDAHEIITKEVERLTHQINNVLDFSRIEMGRKEFNFKSGDLADVILATLSSYRYHLEKKGFLIHTDIAGDLPPMDFDEEAMAGVLINLLSNAMKFSPGRKEVSVRLFTKEGSAVLQVEDLGIGIPVKERDRVFEKFYRVKDEVVAEAGGSGLGLSLVKHVVEAHGGRITIGGEPGKGSLFSVILPIEKPSDRG
jgi:signal transduction histidine kinase